MVKELKSVRADDAVNNKKYILAVVLDPQEDDVVELFVGTGKELAKLLVDMLLGDPEYYEEEGVDFEDIAEVLAYIEAYIEENADIESIVTLATL